VVKQEANEPIGSDHEHGASVGARSNTLPGHVRYGNPSRKSRQDGWPGLPVLCWRRGINWYDPAKQQSSISGSIKPTASAPNLNNRRARANRILVIAVICGKRRAPTGALVEFWAYRGELGTFASAPNLARDEVPRRTTGTPNGGGLQPRRGDPVLRQMELPNWGIADQPGAVQAAIRSAITASITVRDIIAHWIHQW